MLSVIACRTKCNDLNANGMQYDDDFDLEGFIEKLKAKRRILDALDAVECEIQRTDSLCWRVKGAVGARKLGLPYRESLKRLYLVIRTGDIPNSLTLREKRLFSSVLALFTETTGNGEQ